MRFQAPKGVSEYLPPRSWAFEYVKAQLLRQAKLAGYQPIELPVFEDTELFARGVGESTDVVTKEMYTFTDRGDRSITLRPEGTAGVMRAVIEHGLDRGQLPVKLFYSGPFFRAERPQAGRYRQFYQAGIEAIGIDDPALDVEVIAIAYAGFKSLGLERFVLKITSLGDFESRAAHRVDLLKFIETLTLDDETRSRAAKNPLRLFDDKRAPVREAMSRAPLLSDYLTENAQRHFDRVQSLLNELAIPFQVDKRMVRGLDYYTGTTFEFSHLDLGAQSGIGGGGRYDGLMQELGGQSLSGIGFGLGIDRVILACEAEGISLKEGEESLDLFLIPISEDSRTTCVALASRLRNLGVIVDVAYGDRGLKGAMKSADKRGALHVLVIGDDEIGEGFGNVKEMKSGESRRVRLDALEISGLLNR
jgi:histidyl-tRNA synthetase